MPLLLALLLQVSFLAHSVPMTGACNCFLVSVPPARTYNLIGLIIGLILGVLVIICCIVIILCVCWRLRRRK